MANDCSYDSASLLAKFKDSIFYLWFSHIDDAVIEKVIQSILDCPPTDYIYRQCPRIFCCWIVREIAICLNAFKITSDGTDPVVGDIEDDPLVSYVKKDVVRDELREYFEPLERPCTDCKDFPLGKIKAQAQGYLDMCKGANKLLGGVGTNFGRKDQCGTCLKDDYKI